MLKVGDRVFINGSDEEGTVKQVHPHEVVVRVSVPGGHEDRKYALEAVRLDPTLGEVSKFVDH
jgi:6-pyruvoyl-tetrahydropterin synthase